MQGIRGHTWIENCADEAVAAYTELSADSEIGDRLFYTEAGTEIHGQEPGSTLAVDPTIVGRRRVALIDGPSVKLNPSISLSVACPSAWLSSLAAL